MNTKLTITQEYTPSFSALVAGTCPQCLNLECDCECNTQIEECSSDEEWLS